MTLLAHFVAHVAALAALKACGAPALAYYFTGAVIGIALSVVELLVAARKP